MPLCSQTTLFKTKTYWRQGPPVFMGVLDLVSEQFVVIAEIEMIPYQDAELLLELHGRRESGSRIHHGKLEVTHCYDLQAPNLVGFVEVENQVFKCTALITPENVKSKSMRLDFWDIEKEEKPSQPALSLKRRRLRQVIPRPPLR
ncbi:hypothetical protein [Shimia thalassica]|uniref:hypothetical protein n=1 Tax=Shimia thalassica TaxID=1715693 RepID=UPI0026E11861|nr:hypothetical protein [Shimia thalassica]MDO6481417.1 hypothetical protein [Shimia thalassica]